MKNFVAGYVPNTPRNRAMVAVEMVNELVDAGMLVSTSADEPIESIKARFMSSIVLDMLEDEEHFQDLFASLILDIDLDEQGE